MHLAEGAVVSSKPERLSLSEAFNRLCRLNRTFHIFGIEAIAKVIESGRVVLYGVRQLELLPTKIDEQEIRAPDLTCILDNKLYLKNSRAAYSFKPGDFEQVEIEWQGLNEVGRDMWPDRWPSVHRPSDPQVAKAFRESAARYLQAQTRPTRSAHIRELQQELPGMTEDQYGDAKKKAIKDGILPHEWARAGRPKIAVKNSAP
jgi:hypothetical protein